MKDRLLLLSLFLILSTSAFAQTTGQLSPVILSNGSATFTLDFSNQDYELILYSTVTDESDTARTFSYTVSGPAATAKPIALHAPKPASPSDWDRLEAQLREEERILSERLRLQGGYRPPAQKIALAQQINSTRSFVFNSFGNVTSDQNITATLVATSSRAVAYLDNALPDTVKLNTAQIQSHVDRFSSSTYDAVTGVFGAPHDVDADGKVIFLYTHLVDQVGGTAGFYSSSSVLSTDQGGNGNVADMMFIGTDHDPAFFESLLAHEFQHLISFNQHVLVNNGTGEVSWLNEAMSHVCEDLINQHVQGGNRTLVEKFLDAPSVYSLIGSAGRSSGIRGEAYLFARNLMESFGSDIPSRLVQTGRSGIENVEAVTGQNFSNLYQIFVSRLFLTGSGLNNSLNYTFPFFTESTTSKRAIPPPRESGISPEAVTVTGAVKPMATAFLRLMGQGETPITITTESAGDFNAILIPLPQNFRHQLALAADFFPGITLDAALEGLFTSGEGVRISGTVADTSQKRLLLRLDPLDEMGDTLRFQTNIVDGKFGRSIVFHPSQAKDYKLNFFMGPETGDLPFIGRFSPVTVLAGTGPVNLPVDFFSPITLDTAFPGTITAGEGLPFSGTVSDPAIGELLLRFVPLQGSQDTIKFTIGVTDGKFSRSILFSNAQANDYELDVFAGQKDQPKPFLDGFSPITVSAGDGTFHLPTDFFPGITMNSPIPGTYTAGQGVSLAGTVSDPALTQVLFRFDPKTGGDPIRFFVDVTNGQFGRGIVFQPTQGGDYDLVVFGGPQGESLDQIGQFSFVTVTATGSERVALPVDFFPGIVFDAPVDASFFAGQEVRFAGRMTDPAITQLLFRFDPPSGDPIRFFAVVTDGRFNHPISFDTGQIGTYEMVIFAGPEGTSLPFVGRYSSVDILAAQPAFSLRQNSLRWGETGVGQADIQTLILQNIGAQELSVSAGAPPESPFSVPSNALTIAPGDSAVLAVTFSPTKAGSFAENLQLTTNDPTRPTVQISLLGSAVVQALPELTLRTNTLNFGPVEAGTTLQRQLTIVNTGTETLEVNNVTGANEPFGAILPTVIPVFRIAPGDSVEVQVTFTPNTAGDFTSALTITGNNVPDAQITLIGTSPSTSTDPTLVALTPDFNGDGLVNFSDFLAFAAAFGTSSGDAFYDARFDLDSSGDIAFPDFLTFAAAFGKPVEG